MLWNIVLFSSTFLSETRPAPPKQPPSERRAVGETKAKATAGGKF